MANEPCPCGNIDSCCTSGNRLLRSLDITLQRVKSDMVKTIRHTHQLETEVDELDVKIGLLVHNRITLQVRWCEFFPFMKLEQRCKSSFAVIL